MIISFLPFQGIRFRPPCPNHIMERAGSLCQDHIFISIPPLQFDGFYQKWKFTPFISP